MSQKLPFAGHKQLVPRRENLLEKGLRSMNFRVLKTPPPGGIRGVTGFSAPVNCVYNLKLIRQNRVRTTVAPSFHNTVRRRQEWMESFSVSQNQSEESSSRVFLE